VVSESMRARSGVMPIPPATMLQRGRVVAEILLRHEHVGIVGDEVEGLATRMDTRLESLEVHS
jgi:hypothetical protein